MGSIFQERDILPQYFRVTHNQSTQYIFQNINNRQDQSNHQTLCRQADKLKPKIKIIISSSTDEDVLEMLDISLSNGIAQESILVITHSGQEKLKTPDKVRRVMEPRFTKNKYLIKTYRLFLFGYLLLTTKPQCIFTNSSLTYKAWQKIFNFKHITYHRALLLDPNHKFGFSEKLCALLKLKNNDFLNPYHSDTVVTIGDCNKKYMIAKGTPGKNIILVGPTWLEKPISSPETANNITPSMETRRVIFITQAFEHHGYIDQHNSQLSFLKDLQLKLSANDNISLFVKKHPRDTTDYLDLASDKIKIIDTPAAIFLSTILETDIIVTPFSTMSLELAFRNAKIIFYSTDSLDKVYSASYDKYNIQTIKDLDTLISTIEGKKTLTEISLSSFFSQIDKTIPLLKNLSKSD